MKYLTQCTCSELPRAVTPGTKTATLTFRIDPALKKALRTAAQ